MQNQVLHAPSEQPMSYADFGLSAGLIMAILGFFAREVRWHRKFGKVVRERDDLHRSLNPPREVIITDPPAMPPWGNIADDVYPPKDWDKIPDISRDRIKTPVPGSRKKR